MSLAAAPLGKRFRIVGLRHGGLSPHRLMEMGFVEGMEVQVLRRAPLGDPLQLRLGDYESRCGPVKPLSSTSPRFDSSTAAFGCQSGLLALGHALSHDRRSRFKLAARAPRVRTRRDRTRRQSKYRQNLALQHAHRVPAACRKLPRRDRRCRPRPGSQGRPAAGIARPARDIQSRRTFPRRDYSLQRALRTATQPGPPRRYPGDR